ncbi:hypothetical protein PYCC9005_002306 [Savitreella phatthalungensis]
MSAVVTRPQNPLSPLTSAATATGFQVRRLSDGAAHGSRASSVASRSTRTGNSASMTMSAVRSCDVCFSRIEQERCRRMLGLDIDHVDPRTAAQMIRDSARAACGLSPSTAAVQTTVLLPPNTVNPRPLPDTNAAVARATAALQTSELPPSYNTASGSSSSAARRRRRRADREAATAAAAIAEASTTTQPPARPVPQLRYVGFTVQREDKVRGEECPICFEEFEEGETAARLECWCVYHLHCICAWRDQKDGTRGCPLHFHDAQ